MNNEDILRIAYAQSAEDIGCLESDFRKTENVIVPFRLGAHARKYYKEPIACTLVSYGSNLVAAVTEEVSDLLTAYIGRYPFEHCFETPNMLWLDERLSHIGYRICFMAEYFLPDVNRIPEGSCAYEMRLLDPPAFKDLYLPEWSNALCAERKECDCLAVAAYDGDKLIGLAGCSADCADMWQIGVDVLPAYRRQGIASALTSRLANEILKREKVPFYCSAWSNLRSVRNALKCGFAPAWVEMTVKPAAFVHEMNRRGGDASDNGGERS